MKAVFRSFIGSTVAEMKLLYLGLLKMQRLWERPIKDWKATPSHLAIYFEGRLPV